MKNFFLILIAFIASTSFSQKDSTLYIPDHFKIAIKEGYNKARFTRLTGSYRVFNKVFTGGVENYNNNIDIGLNYTFSHAKEFAFTQKRKDIHSKKEIKKIFKNKKRYVDPKSIFISSGVGIFFSQNRIDDPNNIFLPASIPSWTIYGNVEIGLKKQYYCEIGMELSQYWNIKRTKFIGLGSTAFVYPKVNIGISKRFIHPTTNRNIINVHAGIGISYTLTEKGVYAETGNGTGNGNVFSPSSIIYTQKSSINHQVFPSFYIVLEKDLQLTKNIYLSLKYKYDQGFITASETVIQYNTDKNTDFYNKTATSKINGTAHTYSAGFKWRFTPK